MSVHERLKLQSPHASCTSSVDAIHADDGRRLLATQPIPGIALCHIGECIESGLWLEQNQQRRALAPMGYVHSLD